MLLVFGTRNRRVREEFIMKKLLSLVFVSVSFLPGIIYAQGSQSSAFNNMGISLNVSGIIFGEYELGIFTFLNQTLQLGLNSGFYQTRYLSPEISGWQSEIRANYFFSTFYSSGFYMGAATGYENLSVRKNKSESWNKYNDLTWKVVPGYSWVLSKSFSLMLGLSLGYDFGDTVLSPEINFLYIF